MKVGKRLISWGFDDHTEDDDYEWAWEDFIEELDSIIERKHPNGDCWKGEVNNFGWRVLDGHAVIRASNAAELLQRVLPKTDCHFHIHNYGRGIAIQNYHHDSPVGREWYYLVPCMPGEHKCVECGCR